VFVDVGGRDGVEPVEHFDQVAARFIDRREQKW